MIHESREGEGLFPEQIDHVFQIIDRFFAEELVLGKRVFPVPPAASEVLADERRGELRFAHGHRYSEGKYRIDETVRIADADKAFPAETAHLVGVVGDNVHLLNEVHFRYSIPKLRVDIVELVPEKLFGSLLFGEKVCVGRDHSYTDNVLVEWNEPRPVKLFRVEDQSVVFRFLTRSAGATDGAGDLREERDLLVVVTKIFWTGDTLVGEKGCLARAIEHHLSFDVLALAVRPANRDASHRTIIGQ